MRKYSTPAVRVAANPHYAFNTDIDRHLAEIGDRVRRLESYTAARMNEIKTHSPTRTLTNKETQRMNLEKTLELQQRIIEEL